MLLTHSSCTFTKSHPDTLAVSRSQRQWLGDLKCLWDLIKKGPEFMPEQGESQFDLDMTRMHRPLSDSLWIYNL